MRDPQEIRDRFAVYLKAIMLEKGYTIKALAEDTGLGFSTIVSYRGATKSCSLVNLVYIAEVLEVRVGELVP